MFRWYRDPAEMFVSEWTDNELAQFEKLFNDIQQVCVFVRSSDESSNPYDAEQRKGKIISNLGNNGYIEGVHYVLLETPKLVGRYNA